MLSSYRAIVFFLPVFCLSCLKEEKARKEFNFYHDGADTLAVFLKNRGEVPAEFSLKLNGFLPASLDEIVDTIVKIPDGPGKENIIRKAWYFVYGSTVKSSPVTSAEWYHSPELILNSTGFGLSDDRATILAQIWRYLGFQSRLVSLTGHVVPEVYENGKWQMYDPHFGVFFPMQDGLAANIEELASCDVSFNHCFSIDPAGELYFRLRKDFYIKKITSTEDNSAFTLSGEQNTIPDFTWILPQGAEMIFPGRFSGEVLKGFEKPVYRYAQLKMILVPSSSQQIKVPLVLYSIKGTGEISIRGERYPIGSDSLANEIKRNGCFNEKLTIRNPNDTATILFFINPLFSHLGMTNRIVTEGYGLVGVSGNWKWIPDEERLKYFLEDTVAGFLDRNRQFIHRIDSIKSCFSQNDTNMFVHLIEQLIYLLPELSDKEKTKKVQIIKERYAFFLGMISHTRAYEEFRHILNHPEVAFVAINILEANSPEDMKKEFEKYAGLFEKK